MPSKPSKPQLVREAEADGIRQELVKYSVVPETLPEVQPFWDTLRAFQDDGHSSSGSLKLPRIHRKLVWKLTTRPNVESCAVLEYTGKKTSGTAC